MFNPQEKSNSSQRGSYEYWLYSVPEPHLSVYYFPISIIPCVSIQKVPSLSNSASSRLMPLPCALSIGHSISSTQSSKPAHRPLICKETTKEEHQIKNQIILLQLCRGDVPFHAIPRRTWVYALPPCTHTRPDHPIPQSCSSMWNKSSISLEISRTDPDNEK